VPASPATGVDTITGEGLADVMAGADVVVDVSNAPVWDDDAVREFFTTVDAQPAGGRARRRRRPPPRGVDRRRRPPARQRLPARQGRPGGRRSRPGPSRTRILRATQFFEFLPQIAERGADGRQRPALDRADAARRRRRRGRDGGRARDRAPVGGRVELGGPEALGIDAWARRLFAATGDERTVVADPHARYFGTELHGGELTPGDGARIGTIDFETWFATQRQGAER
jgi:hypothetical protein